MRSINLALIVVFFLVTAIALDNLARMRTATEINKALENQRKSIELLYEISVEVDSVVQGYERAIDAVYGNWSAIRLEFAHDTGLADSLLFSILDTEDDQNVGY